MGRSNGIGSKACVIYKRRNIPVLIHEFLHTIDLCHTHIDENGLIENPHQKYVYPKYNADPDSGPLHTTDNIMSYNFNKMKSTWKRQWKILKSI
ncbi:hypothetical protein EAG11_03725 [Flavobacterium sp. 140616W15]|nr:hypothetical protein EAG11_03725 [Flavobacterium sp. 140616W15]